jgi:hypothetical protein
MGNRQRSTPDHITWPKLLRSSARQALLQPARPPAPGPVDPDRLMGELAARAAQRTPMCRPKQARRSRRASELAAKPPGE